MQKIEKRIRNILEEREIKLIESPLQNIEKEELKIFLKDILEDEVDEKYYLSEKQLNKLREYLGKKNKINEEVINCVGTCFGRSGSSSEELESFARTNKALMLGNLSRYKMKSERTITHKEDGVSWGLTGKGDVGIIQINNPKYSNNRVYPKEGVIPTLTEPHHNNLKLLSEYRIRKLTPKECFRLMGFLDDKINLDELSNTQKYKLAGNGWDINLVSKIFKKMFNVTIPRKNLTLEFSENEKGCNKDLEVNEGEN